MAPRHSEASSDHTAVALRHKQQEGGELKLLAHRRGEANDGVAVRHRLDRGPLQHGQKRAAKTEARGHQAQHHVQEVRGDYPEVENA